MRPLLQIVIGAGLVIGSASTAFAQFASSFDQLADITKRGQMLFVIDKEGYESRGRLERIEDGSLTIALKSGMRRFSSDEIVVIRTPGHDSVLNGAAIGGTVAAGMVGIAFAGCSGECHGAGPVLLANFVVGAGIGALVDAFILTPRDIYRIGKHQLGVQPIVSGTRHGANLVLRW